MNKKILYFTFYALLMPSFIHTMERSSSLSSEREKHLERSLSQLEAQVRKGRAKGITAKLSVMDPEERNYILNGEASRTDLQRKTIQQLAQDRLDEATKEQTKIFTKDRIQGAIYSTLVGGVTLYVTANQIFAESCSDNENDSWYQQLFNNLPQLCVAAVPFWESGKELRKVLINYYAERKYEKALAIQQGILQHSPASSPIGTLQRLSNTEHANYRNSLQVAQQNTLNIQHNQETIVELEKQIQELQTLLVASKETDKIQRKQKKKDRKPVIAIIDPESSSYSASKADSKSDSSDEETSPTDDLS